MRFTSMEGRVNSKGGAHTDAALVVERLIESLKRHHVTPSADGNAVQFKNDGFQWSFGLFAGVSHGRYDVNCSQSNCYIDYKLSLSRMLLLVSIATAILFIVIFSARNLTVVQKGLILLAPFLYFFGINYFLLSIRNAAILKRILRK